jgi:hypothetical protein
MPYHMSESQETVSVTRLRGTEGVGVVPFSGKRPVDLAETTAKKSISASNIESCISLGGEALRNLDARLEEVGLTLLIARRSSS